MAFTLAAINEAIADEIPEREALVTSQRRSTWRDFQLRSRRLAHVLIGAGLGCRIERSELRPWESGQDHVALYLYNGTEYLEGMIGAFKARCAPFNVNYRYVDEELEYLLRDARARAVIYHASFAPRLARVLPNLPPMALLLQVEDESGEPLLPGALDYEAALAAASEAPPPVTPSEDDLYIAYTGGTTGMPKGVLWRQADVFFSAMGGRMPGTEEVASLDELRQRAVNGDFMRVLPSPPFMHNAGHWTAFVALHAGGTVVVQRQVRRLDPHDIWTTIERERITQLAIVGDAFARPLLDQLEKRSYDLSSLMIIGSGGAVLSPHLKQALIERIPSVMVVDGFGATETGIQGSTATMAGSEAPKAFRMDDDTVVLDDDLTRRLRLDEGVTGWVARAGRVPLGYLGDEVKTRRTYPTIDGVRYSVPGDRGRYAADGTIVFLGRDSVCINTGGEKVFAEEVETALRAHSAVYDVVVTGTPSDRWGEQVTAVVALRPGAAASEDDLREAAAAHLARFKLPRAFVFVDEILRSPSGKADYRWAKRTAMDGLGAVQGQACR